MARKDETELGRDDFGRVTVRFGEATEVATLFAYNPLDDLETDITLTEEMLRKFTALAADWCRRNPPAPTLPESR